MGAVVRAKSLRRADTVREETAEAHGKNVAARSTSIGFNRSCAYAVRVVLGQAGLRRERVIGRSAAVLVDPKDRARIVGGRPAREVLQLAVTVEIADDNIELPSGPKVMVPPS